MQQQIGQGNVKEHQLIDAKTQLANLHQEETLKKNKVLKKAKEQKTLKPGDEVLVTTYGQRGTLLRKNGNQWQVEIGILKMNVSEDELTPVAPQKSRHNELSMLYALNLAVMCRINWIFEENDMRKR